MVKVKKKNRALKLSFVQTILVISPIIVIIMGLLTILFGMWFWNRLEHENDMPKVLTNKEYNTGREYAVEEYKTYTNNELGFSIKYPAEGYIQDPACFEKGICNGKVHLGECGTDIKDQKLTRSTQLITIDNMLGIMVTSFMGTADEYLDSQIGDTKGYVRKWIFPANWQDQSAILVTATTSAGFEAIPSLIPPVYVFSHYGYIYQLAPVENFGSKSGCLPPAGTMGNSLNSLNWNILKSIKVKIK